MKRKDRKDASPQATPFFVRYLEGQDAEAKVNEGRGQSNFTYKEEARSTKKGGAKKSGAKKSGAKSAAGGKKGGAGGAKAPIITLKYPSDRDEWIFYPYHVEAATAPTAGRQTLKYPSDGDEERGYYAVYVDPSEAPKAETTKAAKPKETGVRLSRRKPKG